MSKEEPTDEEYIAMFMESVKRSPKNKAPGDVDEMRTAFINAIRRAYTGGSAGWPQDEHDDSITGFGDLATELSGSWHCSYDALMTEIGDIITGGIGKLVSSNDPDAPDKIRRLTQVAVAAGYIIALLDDAAADGRKPNAMTAGRQKASTKRVEKIRQFATDNPEMTQTAMAKALGVHRDTVGKALNQ